MHSQSSPSWPRRAGGGGAAGTGRDRDGTAAHAVSWPPVPNIARAAFTPSSSARATASCGRRPSRSTSSTWGASREASPKKKGGGKQTKSLSFKAGDGREWKFRSIDKDPTAVLPRALQRGFVDKVVQDQISASLPANALVTDALAESAGLVTVPRRLVVLPDDPRLGEFRQEFAGMLGMLEEDPQVKAPVTPRFERFTEILETPELWERMEKDSGEQIDERAFLTARLFDMLIGDYDRHKDQWDFGKDRETGLWVAIPKDRDLAFVKFDGLMLDLVRPATPAWWTSRTPTRASSG